MRADRIGLAALAIWLSAGAAQAAERRYFNVPPGALGDALIAFGQQAEMSVGLNDSGSARVYSRGIRGAFTARHALARLLADTHCGYIWIDDRTARVIALSDRSRSARRAPQRSASGPIEAPDIVVTASKQASNLDDYPGGVIVLNLHPDDPALRTAHGVAAILARSPVVSSTNLGPGRDKLFIRGIADSSFTGPTQATVGQYLGDVRLAYNAPDPDLNLYDVESVEILEGPQNTLYGTGTLGGIFRISPRMPDLSQTAASVQAGGVTTAHGGLGADVATMVNIPLSGHVAVRAVGYASRDAGYIDDPGRGLKDINRGRSYGGRLTMRIVPGDDWTLDIGGVIQNIGTRDGQYALTGLPRLTRVSTLAQPFDNDYAVVSATIRKSWNDFELVSATGYVRHDVNVAFDATPSAGAPPRLFLEEDRLFLLSHETRLNGQTKGGINWLVGLAAISAGDSIRRLLGDPAAPSPITGVRNDNDEAALFGRVELPVAPRVVATAGGRLSYSRAIGSPLDTPREEGERTRNAWRVSPSAGLTWQITHAMRLFLSYDEGYRAGGLAVAESGATETTHSFLSDRMNAFQAGLRFGDSGVDRLSGSLILSRTRWHDIQADLIDATGLPFTANIGSGRIDGIEGTVNWSPLDGLKTSLSAFLNDDALSQPAKNIPQIANIDLPNVADLGIAGSISYRATLAGAKTLQLDAVMRHTGRSRLGPPPDLYIAQGRFWEVSAGGRLGLGPFGLSLDVTNLLDRRGNRFSFGNPFSVRLGNQITPLRPRSIRLGFDAQF